MHRVEHHVDVVDVERLDVEWLAAHLRECAEQGWELVTLSSDVDVERFGRSHLLVFKRLGATEP